MSVASGNAKSEAQRSTQPTARSEFAVPTALLRFAQGQAPAGLNNRIPRLQTLSPAEKKQAAPAPRADLSRVLAPISARRNALQIGAYTK